MLSSYRGNANAVSPATSGKSIPVSLTGAWDVVDFTVSGTLTLSAMTQGSVLFAGSGGVVSQDNANLFWNDSTKSLGIGTSSPAATLHVTGNFLQTKNGAVFQEIIGAGDDGAASRGIVGLLKARGTIASPSAVQSGDTLGTLEFGGYNGSAYVTGTQIAGVAVENFTVSQNGSKLVFYATPASSTVLTAYWEISAAGHFLASTDNISDIGAAASGRPRNCFLGGSITVGSAASLVRSSVNMNNGAAANVGTITNAPAAGNPTKWIPINDNGTVRYVPAW